MTLQFTGEDPYFRECGLYRIVMSKHHGPEGEHCYLAVRRQTAEEQMEKKNSWEKGSVALGSRVFSFQEAVAQCERDALSRQQLQKQKRNTAEAA